MTISAHRPALVSWWAANSRTIALAATGISLLLTVGYALVLGNELRFYDEREYLTLVRSMAEGNGYIDVSTGQPTAYRPPGYPMLLLPVYLLSGGSVLAMRLVGVLALAGSVWLVYLLGKRIRSASVGALAAVMMACYPLLVYTATTLYPQVPALFLLLLTIELAMRCTEPETRRRWLVAIVAGLAGGVLALAVPTYAPSLAVLGIWLAWRNRRSIHKGLIYRTLAVVVVATAVLPILWCVRNAVQMDAFIPFSTNNGNNLLLGNSPGVTASGGRIGDISAYERQAEQQDMSEVEQDEFYSGQAKAWIAANPGDAAALYVGKVVHTFSFRNELATGGASDPLKDLVSAVSYYPILALALVRLLLYRRFPLHGLEKLAAGLIAVNVLLLAVFFTRLRLRLPLDGLTILLAAAAVACLVRLWSARRETT